MLTYLVDTREQRPYHFSGCNTKEMALKTGDYSIEFLDKTYENEIVVERKTLSDFISSITQGRERFEKEMKRSLKIPHFYIVIEGSWEQIFKHKYRSRMKPNSVINTILGWQMKYGVNMVLGGTRKRSESITKRLLDLFIKYKKRKKKKNGFATKEVNSSIV